ncbi:MAG: helix-turn-helix transcriptional regulator [Chitinophagaceae bacterium]|nr:helix-turn-helix transcriptional regulator [Chitinophagaceae bacterium]
MYSTKPCTFAPACPSAMEWINDYIYFNVNGISHAKETTCLVSQENQWVVLHYTLAPGDCLFQFPVHQNQISLHIDQAYFEKYNEEVNFNIEKQSICCNTQSKLHELLNCNLQGFARKLFLESTALYLVYQVLKNNLVFNLNCDACSFLNRPLEMEKVQQAKQFILANLETNLTIPSIATQVGTNSCYLKKAFKEVFGQTIFEFVQENRMVKAKHLIEKNQFTLSDISMEVGYSSLSSFSQAYKNYFGISPQKQIKH